MMKKRLQLESGVSMRQFSFFRTMFGIYLTCHFAALIPYAGEIFSNEGIMGAPGINPFEGKWPNPFFIWGSPLVVQLSLAAGVCACVLFLFGKWMRNCALFLWLLHSCLFTANPLTANPSLGYVGMLLLLCAAVPNKYETLPGWIPRSAWILLAAGYSFSGWFKLGSPSWIDGSALLHLMHNPLARPGIARDLMLALSAELLSVMTWSTLAMEVLFVPLALCRHTRPYIWTAMLLMHVGIMLTVDFADLSLGMIMVHLFTFQRSWTATWQRHWRSVRKCFSPNKSYDFLATFGLSNGNLKARTLAEVRNQHTCATLTVATLGYSGFDLHADKRVGRLDVLTPRQVTDAWGVVRKEQTP